MSVLWIIACRTSDWGKYIDLAGPVVGFILLIGDACVAYSLVHSG